MHKQITFVTGNKNKIKQVSTYLDYPITHKEVDLTEIQSLNLHEIVEAKVKEAYRILNSPVLVEDISLTFLALGKLPGPLIKWFLKELGNEGLCQLLTSFDTRDAIAEVCYGYYNGKNLELFEASYEGVITNKPRGDKSFGWNPIFIPKGNKKTWGEMDISEQNATSMRKIALEKLEKFLRSQNE
jgi:non-canonical purine NTP pyrophosphatase (RdgB/HAM1 family)